MIPRFLCGNVLDVLRSLPAESVHAVVSSPPYYGARDYQTPPVEWPDGWKGQLGHEPSPKQYISHLLEVMEEVRRVLRSDGTAWVVMGDTYFGDSPIRKRQSWDPTWDTSLTRSRGGTRRSARRVDGLKPTDLCMSPQQLAIALQYEGWWVKSMVCWQKTQGAPESINGWRWEQHKVKDASEKRVPCPGCSKCRPNRGLVLRRASWRPTVNHEYVLMLTKTRNYYGDREAVLEPCLSGPSDIKKMVEQLPRIGGKTKETDDPLLKASTKTNIGRKRGVGVPGGKNRRSVWRFTGVASVTEGHHAAFPKAIAELCILASTSDAGVCPECGAPWARIVGEPIPIGGRGSGNKERFVAKQGERSRLNTHLGSSIPWAPQARETLGWKPTCGHRSAFPVPATVLDPFVGSGTTCLVAQELGRASIGIDLNPVYIELAKRRCGLVTEVSKGEAPTPSSESSTRNGGEPA